MKFLCVVLVLVMSGRAEDNALLKIGGRQTKDVNPDDVRLMAIMARSLAYKAEKKGTYDEDAKALFAATTEAITKQDWNRAWRLVVRLNTILMGGTPDEMTEMAASYDFQLDQRIMSYADTLTARTEPLFLTDKKLEGSYSVAVTIRDSTGKFQAAAGKADFKEMHMLATRVTSRGLPPGHYFLKFELKTADGKVLSSAERDFFHVPDLRQRLDALKLKLEAVKAKTVNDARKKSALESAEYISALLSRGMKEYVADMNKKTHPFAAEMRANLSGDTSDIFKLPEDLEFAEALAAGLVAGKNPLEGRTGDMRMAYRSAVDNTLQPYRVFLPQGYTPAKKYPLIVALHGATGDENTYLDRYHAPDGKSLLKRLAQERGYILVTPNGRGPYGMYVGNSEKDVLDVIDQVSALFSIRADRVFLTGHSMGGSGTWQVGFRNPKRFRALAPVASGFGGRPEAIEAIPLKDAPELPVLFSYGLKDTLATPESSKRIIAYATPLLKNFKAAEFAGDHFAIGVTSMTGIFNFFDQFRN